MRTKPLLLAAALAPISSLTLASPAQAHRVWLLPSTTILSDPGEGITVDAGIANDVFRSDHAAMDPSQIQVWAPDGTKGNIDNVATGRYRSTFDVVLDQPGTWKIGVEQSDVRGLFKVNGEQWRLGRRGRPGTPQPKAVDTIDEIPANATDVKLTENISRVVFFPTVGQPTDSVFKPTGNGLELVVITPPSDLVSDTPGQFRYLIDGKPATGVNVTVVPGAKQFREEELAQTLTTGADGVVSINWPVAGFYWVSATATDNKVKEPRAQERQMTYTATFEVLAP